MEVVRSRQSLDDGSWSTPLPTRLDGPQTLVVVFGSPDVADDPASATAIAAAFPRSVVVGCSTAGEIHQTQVDDRSLSVAVTRFQHTRLRVASTPVSAASASYGAGQKVARELAAPDLCAVFVLSDGLGVNGSELVRGLNATLGDDVVVTGGLAGDGTRFERTWVLADGTVEPNRIVAVGLYGDHLEVHHGSMGGWDQFGPVRTITRSDGNVLYELDDKPALALYKQYLGDKAAELPSSGLLFPLALRKPGEDKVLVRTLLAVDEAAQSMTFAGDLPVGHTVQLMKADFDRLVDGAAEAADRSKPSVGGPCLTLAISCVGRRLVLGERIEEEVEAVQEHLGDRAEIVGFYSYGELSPAIGSETCDLHNQTMTLTTFSESPVPLPRRRVPRGMTLETVTWRDGRWSGRSPSSSTVRRPS
ncbi:MAG: FIST C-terminal domain-containing protein [Alphaproteobacteria bacterium]|nr:FIST C-terminal domain-containing protein [Alphaproteobacteria bacterium]